MLAVVEVEDPNGGAAVFVQFVDECLSRWVLGAQ